MHSLKKILQILAVSFILFGCNSAKKTDNAQNESMAEKAPIPLPYTPSYSSSFIIGNPSYATMIVQGSWKDWDDNNFDRAGEWMADSVLMVFSNNTTVRGLDSVTAMGKRARAMYTSVHTTIDAVIPVYSTDRKENWVLVWADVIQTNKNGVTDTVGIMETWQINSAGKAAMLLQYDRARRKM